MKCSARACVITTPPPPPPPPVGVLSLSEPPEPVAVVAPEVADPSVERTLPVERWERAEEERAERALVREERREVCCPCISAAVQQFTLSPLRQFLLLFQWA